MKRIGEIKQRREHAFWKQRSVCIHLARRKQPLRIPSMPEWPLLAKSNVHIAPKSWLPSRHPSNWWNRWHWSRHKPRWYWRRSKYQPKAGVLSSGERVSPWVWISTDRSRFVPVIVVSHIYNPPFCGIRVCFTVEMTCLEPPLWNTKIASLSY
jgi:hypothetical protein